MSPTIPTVPPQPTAEGQTSATDGSHSVSPIDPAERLNHFLCDEISAEAAYGDCANRLARGSDASLYLGLLRQLQEEHGLAAEAIQERIRESGGEPADVCGALGVWGAVTHCTSSFFGNDRTDGGHPSTLECLRSGERHNLENYQDAQDALDPSSVQLLQNLLIPAQRRHLHVLEELLGDMTDA